MEEKKVVGLAVHNFYSAPVRVNAEDGRIHGQLEHVRDILEQAVLRRVHQLVPDGEAELDERDIARGDTHSLVRQCIDSSDNSVGRRHPHATALL